MKIKILVIGVVRKDKQVLLRKKPASSPPYKETWYLFGGELEASNTPEQAIAEIVRIQSGVEIKLAGTVRWDTEIKKDVDGVEKYFVYLDAICEYVSGDLKPGPGIERVEWVDIGQLKNYDHIPPSRVLFQKLGYLD